MEEFKISEILSDKLHISEINSKTLTYRVNGFMHACNINLANKEYVKCKRQFEDVFANGLIFNKDKDDEFTIYTFKKQNAQLGDYVHIAGENSDLFFVLDNFYEKKNIDKKVAEIPFSIYINKIHAGSEYILSMESINTRDVQFRLIDEEGHFVEFCATVTNFSKVLNIVKSFVDNPGKVIQIYDEIFDTKRVRFTSNDLDKAIVGEEKPKTGFIKKIRGIINNNKS